MDLMFFLNSILLGFGLAMDAFSVSVANGLNEPSMRLRKAWYIAGAFALFQFGMPLIGWLCIHTIAERFEAFRRYIPWISLVLLVFIGGKMLIEGIRGGDDEESSHKHLTLGTLLIQAVATSIDALSVGFTIADHSIFKALAACLMIGAVTLAVCMVGLKLGKYFASKLKGKAEILGGAILILIGVEIFIG